LNEAAQILIKNLNLIKHPEGGYFAEIYRSTDMIIKEHLPDRFNSSRVFTTVIYFLLTNDDYSSFHKLKADEIWHFYSGSSLILYEIDKDSILHKSVLSDDMTEDTTFTKVVKAGNWLAAEVMHKDSYSLVGCTVSPGFEFDDFELAKREELISLHPQHRNIIEKLTRISIE
jgi:predicted cupin superfamily sugar epimerase